MAFQPAIAGYEQVALKGTLDRSGCSRGHLPALLELPELSIMTLRRKEAMTMILEETTFLPISEFRCVWCGEDAIHWVETDSYGYGTPLCDTCAHINEKLYDMRLIVRRAEAHLRGSALPQVGQQVRHKSAGWRGIGTVQSVSGRLVEVAWIHGYTLHHADEDLRVHDVRIRQFLPRIYQYIQEWVR